MRLMVGFAASVTYTIVGAARVSFGSASAWRPSGAVAFSIGKPMAAAEKMR
jgi:hypothetical protein